MAPSKPQPGIVLNKKLLSYDKVEFTQYALDRLSERGIKRDQVYDAIENPDVEELRTKPGRCCIQRYLDDDTSLRVVYELLDDRIRIISTWYLKTFTPTSPPVPKKRQKPKTHQKKRKKRRR